MLSAGNQIQRQGTTVTPAPPHVLLQAELEWVYTSLLPLREAQHLDPGLTKTLAWELCVKAQRLWGNKVSSFSLPAKAGQGSGLLRGRTPLMLWLILLADLGWEYSRYLPFRQEESSSSHLLGRAFRNRRDQTPPFLILCHNPKKTPVIITGAQRTRDWGTEQRRCW